MLVPRHGGRRKLHTPMIARRILECSSTGEDVPENVRFCKRCLAAKNEDTDFSRYVNGGHLYIHHVCKRCRSYRQNHSKITREKRAFINELKRGPCSVCGQTFLPAQMKLWAPDGNESFDLTNAWTGRSMESIRAESKRQKPVCLNCSAVVKPRKRRRKPVSTALAGLPPDLQKLTGLPDLTTSRTEPRPAEL
jgi:hypothetical protein